MDLSQRYLDLVKSAISNSLNIELEAQLLTSVLCAAHGQVLSLPDFWHVRHDDALRAALLEARQDGDAVILELDTPEGPGIHPHYRNYTEYALTLVGQRRLDHLQQCIETILGDKVCGDLLEAGVWRGGCGILMRAVLAAHGVTDRTVWLCDSFAGLPPSTAAEDRELEMDASRLPFLAVNEAEVRGYFERFGLLDEQVAFVPGWFDDSLPPDGCPGLALLHVDADLYGSTMVVLERCYDAVSEGGFVVVDDYLTLPPCRQAVDEFRRRRQVTMPLREVDAHAVCWRVT